MSPAPGTCYYRARAKPAEAVAAEARLIARIHEICAEFPRYGYRRVTAQLKAEGERVNRKRVARIMREQDLRVRPKRRLVATTDSGHDGPVFPDLAKDLAPTGPDQLWVADLTYIRVLSGFVYLAVILDARSRRVVGWALSRRIDADPAVADADPAVADADPAVADADPAVADADPAVAASEAAAAARRPPRRAASTTPVAARRTRPSRTARSSRSTSFVVRRAGAATRTITPRRRAS